VVQTFALGQSCGPQQLFLARQYPYANTGRRGCCVQGEGRGRGGALPQLGGLSLGTVAAALDKTVHGATDTVLNVSTKLQNVAVEDGVCVGGV
jgi:hypothetical protein